MRITTKFFGIAVALSALTAGVHAQTVSVNFVAAGSSALFLQLGLAAGTDASATPAGVGATCVWSQSSGTSYSLEVTDSKSESGNAWIAWTPGSRSQSCTSLTSSDKTTVYAMVSTDSEIGNRLYFNGGTLGAVSSSPAGSSSSGLIFGTSGEVALPSAIWTALNAHALTAAATDIRPEDAKFASLRALTTGGSVVGSSAQYLGLGYSGGDKIFSAFGTSPSHFNVVDFTLPTDGSYAVLPIGAVPVVVAVNTTNASGFGGLTFGGSTPASIDLTTLAKYLDGSYGYTGDISGSASGAAATILIREPLSGTFNTVEYAVPNTTTLETSQEVGVNQTVSQRDLAATSLGAGTGTVPYGYSSTLGGYQFILATNDNSSAYRERVIGTGQSISELLSTQDALGYAFWSTSNYKGTTAYPTSNARYLTIKTTVNGIVHYYDPLYTPSTVSGSTYETIANTIPTSGNGYLTDVTFSDLQAGNYPIWSLLRLVTATSGIHHTAANLLAYAAQNFVNSSGRPDFVPFNNNTTFTSVAPLKVFHSHFAPPGVNFYSTGTNVAANGTSAYTPKATKCTDAEAGGDVGGVIGAVNDPAEGGLSESDEAYCSASGNPATGQTGHRM